MSDAAFFRELAASRPLDPHFEMAVQLMRTAATNRPSRLERPQYWLIDRSARAMTEMVMIVDFGALGRLTRMGSSYDRLAHAIGLYLADDNASTAYAATRLAEHLAANETRQIANAATP